MPGLGKDRLSHPRDRGAYLVTRFSKPRNGSTLPLAPPFCRTADQPTLRGPHLDNLTFNFKGATRRSAPFRFTPPCLKCGLLAGVARTSALFWLSIDWCNGVRFICTNLVQSNLTLLHQKREWIFCRFRAVAWPKAGDYPLSIYVRPIILARDPFSSVPEGSESSAEWLARRRCGHVTLEGGLTLLGRSLHEP